MLSPASTGPGPPGGFGPGGPAVHCGQETGGRRKRFDAGAATSSARSFRGMNIVQHTLIFVIRVYQAALSPMILAVLGPSARCRFTPSCSQYAREAVRLHGAMVGG